MFSALEAEQKAIDRMLGGLSPSDWASGSLCPGWSVSDVVLHLAQTEEAVVASIEGGRFGISVPEAKTVDDLMAGWVAAERGAEPVQVLERWRSASEASLDALRTAPPDSSLQWAAAPLKPRTLATTRLSEHWIHALDVSQPLGLPWPDTERLWHIARLAHRTLPYAYMRAGRDDPPGLFLDLVGPDGVPWTFGDPGAECVIAGSAGEFCRVAGRRLAASETSLSSNGERASEVLELIRTYA